jgi:hypothetical protein
MDYIINKKNIVGVKDCYYWLCVYKRGNNYFIVMSVDILLIVREEDMIVLVGDFVGES